MASTGLEGPFWLNEKTIDEEVTETSPGTYVLGYNNTSGVFIVEYVGRSDSDVATRLKSWVDKGYLRFKYGYFSSPKAAFEKECRIYHDFGESEKLNNKYHPDRPEDADWECPVCDIFD